MWWHHFSGETCYGKTTLRNCFQSVPDGTVKYRESAFSCSSFSDPMSSLLKTLLKLITMYSLNWCLAVHTNAILCNPDRHQSDDYSRSWITSLHGVCKGKESEIMKCLDTLFYLGVTHWKEFRLNQLPGHLFIGDNFEVKTMKVANRVLALNSSLNSSIFFSWLDWSRELTNKLTKQKWRQKYLVEFAEFCVLIWIVADNYWLSSRVCCKQRKKTVLSGSFTSFHEYGKLVRIIRYILCCWSSDHFYWV